MIEVDRLSRSYGELRAVDDVSFRIGQGEVVGLLGHNGAGKTTVMKMLTGYLEPSAGRVRIDGMDIAGQRREVQLRIGYLPENCPVYPEMTVIDYLEYQAALHGVGSGQRSAAIRTAIERTELGPKAGDVIATLSRGYRQRVGVAQSILHGPAVLVLDEPTNGLDPSQIQHMRALVRELARTATVILSTHILQEVEAACDRVLIMRSGRLAMDARLGEISSSRRLLVTLDRPPGEAELLFTGLESVSSIEPLEAAGGRYVYALATSNPDETAPRIADRLSSAGWPLYALTPEVRSLETLFGEINEIAEVAHA